MLKYSKELEYIINYYHNEEKKRNFLKNKAINNMSKNMNLMYKIQEVSNFKIILHNYFLIYLFRFKIKISKTKSKDEERAEILNPNTTK
jgi:predicted metal-binding protein